MYRDLFISKWIIGGFGFLIVFSISCYFWYQHELAPYKQEAVETQYLLEISQKATDVPHTDSIKGAPANREVATTDTAPENTDDSKSQRAESLEKMSADVPVSPHGFGPYPDVPDDYIMKPFSWDFYKNDPPIFELMARVRVKLWKQGIRTTGITSSSTTSLVYPTIPGVVFVKRYNRDGIDHLEIRGDPNFDLEVIRDSLMAGNVPDGVTIRDLDEAGIDPYIFLNLKR